MVSRGYIAIIDDTVSAHIVPCICLLDPPCRCHVHSDHAHRGWNFLPFNAPRLLCGPPCGIRVCPAQAHWNRVRYAVYISSPRNMLTGDLAAHFVQTSVGSYERHFKEVESGQAACQAATEGKLEGNLQAYNEVFACTAGALREPAYLVRHVCPIRRQHHPFLTCNHPIYSLPTVHSVSPVP